MEIWVSLAYRLHAVHFLAHGTEQLHVDLSDAVDGHEVVVAGVLLDIVVSLFDEVAVLLVEEDFVVALRVEVHALVQVCHDLDHRFVFAVFEVLYGFVHVLQPLLLLQNRHSLDLRRYGVCLQDEARVVLLQPRYQGLGAVLPAVLVRLRREHQLEYHALRVLQRYVGHELEDVGQDRVVRDV